MNIFYFSKNIYQLCRDIIKEPKMRKLFWLFMFLPTWAIAQHQAQQISCEKLFEPVIKTMRANDAEGFSAYFAEVVEFDILGEERMYSKKQALQIIKDLFARLPVKYISLKHCSGKEYLKYATGTVTDTYGSHYRITIFVNTSGDKLSLQQFRVEKQE
jgi:hypothetical protein